MNIQQKKEMLIELGTFVDKNWLDEQFEWCMMRIKKNMVRFGLDFPSACATNGKYRIKKNDDWTNDCTWNSNPFCQSKFPGLDIGDT